MIWLNGRLREPDAAIDPADRGFTLGDGLFETIRIAGSQPRHLARHLARLRAGAALLAIPVPFGDDAIAAAITDLLGAAGIANGSVRITLTRGVQARGVLPAEDPQPTLLLTASPAAPQPGPARLVIAGTTTRNEMSPLARIKSLNYLDQVLARQEAARRSSDEAVLLNTKGRVADATAANLFVAIDGVLATPPVTDGALPGIARGLIIERLGAVERALWPADLRRAQAIILTNALGIRPAISLDGTTLPEADPRMLQQITEAWR
jgi:branched-chain amino acid aminotransferase